MKSLRILHLAPFGGEAWAYGGIPRVVEAVTHELARRGHRVTVCATDACTSNRRSERLHFTRSDGVEMRLFRNLSNRLAYRFQAFLPRGMGEYLDQEGNHFDVAHIHGCHHLPGVIAAKRLTRLKVPYLISPHGTAPLIERRKLAKWVFQHLFEREIWQGCAEVLATTAAEARQLTALVPPGTRIQIVPNPVVPLNVRSGDASERSRAPSRWKLHYPVVAYLGKLTPRKGVDVLIRSLLHLPTSTHLLVAGNDMGEGPQLRLLACRLGVAHRVTFAGLLVGAERWNALCAADVVAYPSKEEVFGLVPLEAILMKRPVVVCDDSGCGEVIRSIDGGEVVPYGDPRRLASAIARLIEPARDSTQRLDLAREQVLKRFSPSSICAQLETEYRRVLHGD